MRPGAKVPFGYNQVDKKLVPNEKADIVTFIFYLHSWGSSMAKIATILNEANIPAPQGGLWRSSTVEKILKNPVYTGRIVWRIEKGKNKTSYEFDDSHEPLIDPFLLNLNENNIKLQHEFGRIDTPFLFLNKLICRDCSEKLITQNGSTTRKGKKYFYQYYVCSNCNYKLDIQDVHEKLQSRVLSHIHSLTINEDIQSQTLDYLNRIGSELHENTIYTQKHLDKILSKGSIAIEEADKELEQFLITVTDKYLKTLESLSNSEQVLQELYEAVQSGLFFERFKQVLALQLNDSEKRLINLYFIDHILISSSQPFQIVYHENVFESFQFLLDGQTTELS